MAIGMMELIVIALSCFGCIALLSVGGAVTYFVMNR
jgi:hypothetical protein